MSNINKAAVLNPFNELTANILNYVPRATTSEFGIVAIGSGINVDALGRIYLDTQEYSDRLSAIEAQAASTLATQKSEVAAAIAQVNLAQSQTITALTLEVNTLKTNLTNEITTTKTDLINRADQLAQDVTDITVQLTQDKAAFTQEIQDALVYLENAESVASALRTPRKIQGVDFDGTQDISLPTFSTQIDGLTPKRVGATTTKYLREDGTWVVPTDTTYALLTTVNAEDGTATSANTISAKVLKEAIQYHAPTVTNIAGNAGTATKLAIDRTIALSGAAAGTATSFDGSANISIEVTSLDAAKLSGTASIPTTGNAGTATKLQTPRTINGVSFDGTQNILLPEAVVYSLPTASASVLGGIKVGSGLTVSNSVLSVGTLNQSTTGNAATSTKLQTARTISLTGNVTGSVSFDGSANASIETTVTGLGAANGIATLDSNGQVPSTQLPSYVDAVLEYLNVAAFPVTGESGKIYVETTGNTTYRWGSTAYVKITSGEVASVAGKTGVVTLTKADVGLTNVDDTTDSTKSVASAAKLTTVRTINGANFDGTFNVTTPTWGTPRTLTIGRTGKSVDGSTNVAWTADEILPTGYNGQVLKHNGTSWVPGVDTNTSYATLSASEANAGTSTSVRVITAAVLKGAIQTHAPVSGCRAWLSVNTVTSTILQSFNIASFVKTATGQFEIAFTTPMPHQNYVAFTNSIAVKGEGATSNTVGSTFNATQTNTVSRCYIWCWSTSSGALVNPEVLNVGVFC